MPANQRYVRIWNLNDFLALVLVKSLLHTELLQRSPSPRSISPKRSVTLTWKLYITN